MRLHIFILAFLVSALQTIRSAEAATHKNANIKRAVELLDKSDVKGARALLETECQKARQSNDVYREANSRVMLGQIYTVAGSHERGIENLTVALELCQRMADDSVAVRETQILAFSGLGIYYITARGNYYAGKEYFLRAMKLAQQAGDERLTNIIETNLLQAALIQRDTTMLEQTRRLYERTANDAPRRYAAAVELAQQYIFRGQDDLAEPLIREAHSLNDAVMSGDRVRLPLTEADLYSFRGDYAKAHALLADALKMIDSGNEAAFYKGIILSRQADLSIRQKKYDEAISYALEALNTAKTSPQKTNVLRILQQLTEAYEHLGDNSNALKYARQYEEYLLQSHNEYREYLVRDLNASYNLDKKEAEAENARIMFKRERQLNLVLAFSLLLIFAIAFILWRAYVQKNKLYRRLTKAYTTSAKNEKSALEKGISQNDNPDNDNADQRIYQALLNYISANNDWSDATLGRETVADAIGTNRTYLSRAVKECTRLTYAQFINHVRINRAIEILSDKTKTDYPLKTLSAELGFGSLNAFYANFKTATGMTPAVFRKNQE